MYPTSERHSRDITRKKYSLFSLKKPNSILSSLIMFSFTESKHYDDIGYSCFKVHISIFLSIVRIC